MAASDTRYFLEKDGHLFITQKCQNRIFNLIFQDKFNFSTSFLRNKSRIFEPQKRRGVRVVILKVQSGIKFLVGIRRSEE